VIVPAFNEAETIALVLERVSALDLDTEIIVVDDSSTDRTLDAITEADIPGVRVVRHPVNQGKGAAVRTGLAEASGDVIVIQDADLEYHPNDFTPMLKLIESGEARVVYGYRDFSSQRFLLRAGNQALTYLTNLLYGVAIMPAGHRRDALTSEVEAMLQEDFAGRVLPFDSDAARAFAEIAAACRAAGRPVSQSDGQIAAIARSRGMAVATRNTRHFEGMAVDLVAPLTAS